MFVDRVLVSTAGVVDRQTNAGVRAKGQCVKAVLRTRCQPRAYADAILRVCRLYAESPLSLAGMTGADLKKTNRGNHGES
jgi:hypothetical protein